MSSGQERDDLIAFAGYCAARISRDLAGVARWDLYLVSGLDGQATAVVRAHLGGTAPGTDGATVEARANDCDPAHAIWSAMCQVEQPLRDAAAASARVAA